MGRYENWTSLLCIFVLFFFCPMVLSQLSSNQISTMITLSQLLNSGVSTVPWNITKQPNPCSWDGIICDLRNSSIIEISLNRFSISSPTFLPVLCQIDSLRHLDVSNNSLSSIPNEFITDCGKIDGLKLLNFSQNKLVGHLPTFQGFSGLEFLDMSFNILDGNIDLQLDGLISLKSLNLSYNHFTGSVPAIFGNSKVLERLVLSANNFTRIPDEILSFKNLTLIDLSVNQLRGSILDRIGELSKLETLILSSNNLSGKIPQTLSSITTLSRFAAYQNKFSGAIPSGITKFLRNLDLSYNELSGSIPSDLLSHSNLQTVDLSNNVLKGSIPANLSTSLVRLRLGVNMLRGMIPVGTFAILQKLTYLEMENNSLTGLIPSELGSCRSLALLNLAENKLTGELPAELGNLNNMQVLKLQMNKFFGPIPTQITQLQKLSTLNFSWNSLTGSIPSTISGLKNLINLNLQGNSLSGPIPKSVGSMSALIELQLGSNQLSGELPNMPENLQIALNLSSNLFQGTIPSHLSALMKLEVLDLANNKFSGEVPEFLTKMETLIQLLLSNNQLSGIIPKFREWVTVEYRGNRDLRNITTPSTSPRSAKKGKSVALAIIIAVAAAVFVVGIVTILAISISRRYSKVNDEHFPAGENVGLPQAIQGNLLTANGIHRSNIDFSKVMEAVAVPSNIVLKTRFSTYYKAIMPSGSIYFVKKLNWSEKLLSLGSHDKFGKELEILGKLNNSNIMTPLAYVLSVENAYLFYEFAPKGPLFYVLHGSLGNALDWASRYSIAIGVAQGIAFLHGHTSGPLLLLDLSSRNVMLKSLKEPLVGDIELLKVIDPSKSTGSLSTVAGSVGYIPPEYAYTMRVTTAGNVYSFGVVLLELLTGKPAVTEGTELVKWVLRKSTQQDHILDLSISRTSPAVKNQMLAVLRVAIGCVSDSPEARPKMKSVLRMLLNAK
ncbi:Leucine-rich repeat protein kinase family protein [Quillaja saponaria]|uniref:Leucine-rich repeat protein kinase family protein n=1 Tax=Quillaja saponaria TaxID=32244 RepID=A0AAD7VFQ7_QUISA|nr:Leucine-rich repeat protein kinase family protein [Quillaja saponaria]